MSIFMIATYDSKITHSVSWMLWDTGPRPSYSAVFYCSIVDIQARRYCIFTFAANVMLIRTRSRTPSYTPNGHPRPFSYRHNRSRVSLACLHQKPLQTCLAQKIFFRSLGKQALKLNRFVKGWEKHRCVSIKTTTTWRHLKSSSLKHVARSLERDNSYET